MKRSWGFGLAIVISCISLHGTAFAEYSAWWSLFKSFLGVGSESMTTERAVQRLCLEETAFEAEARALTSRGAKATAAVAEENAVVRVAEDGADTGRASRTPREVDAAKLVRTADAFADQMAKGTTYAAQQAPLINRALPTSTTGLADSRSRFTGSTSRDAMDRIREKLSERAFLPLGFRSKIVDLSGEVEPYQVWTSGKQVVVPLHETAEQLIREIISSGKEDLIFVMGHFSDGSLIYNHTPIARQAIEQAASDQGKLVLMIGCDSASSGAGVVGRIPAIEAARMIQRAASQRTIDGLVAALTQGPFPFVADEAFVDRLRRLALRLEDQQKARAKTAAASAVGLSIFALKPEGGNRQADGARPRTDTDGRRAEAAAARP